MAKSKIISASIAVDIQNLQEVTGAVQGLSKDLSNIPIDKNLETRLKNVEKTVTNVVRQISAMTDKIDVLSKAGGLDPKTLNDLSLLTSAISDVKIEVDALTTKVNNFSKGISDVGDIGVKKVSENITKEIGDMANNIDESINNATVSIQKGGEKLKKAYEQLLQSVNVEVDAESIDASKIFKFSDEDDVEAEFKKVKTKLQKDLKDLADTTNKYNELKVSGASADDMAKAAKAQVNALNKLKESFEAFYGMEDLEDRVGENMTKGMTESINEVIKSFPNLQGEVYRTFDEIYDFIDAIMENISNDFTASLNTLKESLKSVSAETKEPTKKATTDTKLKAKSAERAASSDITADVVIKEGVGAELIAELKTVISDLQKYVDKNPVELDAVINPTWGTKQTQKYLKSIRAQLSKTKNGKIDENLAARIYGLQDAFGKDFSEALNKSISKLKDSLQKEGFSVGKLKIEDTAVKDFREQISNEIGAITVDINANILGTTVVDKDKTEAVNQQFEELRALGKLDPGKINDLVKTIKSTGADLDYSDIYKDRLKQIVKGLVDGIYGSVPEAIAKTRYPQGANPLIGEYNDNARRLKELISRVEGGATGDSFAYFKNQIEALTKRQQAIIAELSQNVEGVPDSVAEEIKEASQQIATATIEVATATININNADATFTNITTPTPAEPIPAEKVAEEVPAKVEEVAQAAEATLTATREELVALANQRFKELVADESNENINFENIDSLVNDLKKLGIEKISSAKFATSSTTGLIVDSMLKGEYTSALEAFKSIESQIANPIIKATQEIKQVAEQQSEINNKLPENTSDTKNEVQNAEQTIKNATINISDANVSNPTPKQEQKKTANYDFWEYFKTKIYPQKEVKTYYKSPATEKNIQRFVNDVINSGIEKFYIPKTYQNNAVGQYTYSLFKKTNDPRFVLSEDLVNITQEKETVSKTANEVQESTQAVKDAALSTRDELVRLANERFKELISNENDNEAIDFKAIDKFVGDLRKADIKTIDPKFVNTTTGRTVDAMLKGGYTSALEAFQSTASHSEEAKAKALEAQQMSKLFERFQKLYAMQTIQEKGTGSEKSIQMFVDAVRKSGVDFKVNPKYQDNEIGQLVSSMLTSGYKTVAEAIAVRDNKPIEQGGKKNIENATLNVTNLTIKGQQHIQEVTQKITSANITITKGDISQNTTVSEPVNTEKKNNNTKKEKDDRSQKFIDEYNNNVSNRGNESFGDYLLKQGNLLSKILNNNIKVKKKDVSSIESYQQYIDKINKILDSTTDEALKKKLSQIKSQLSSDYEIVNKSVSKDNAETIQTSIQDIIENAGSVDEISKTLSSKSSEIDKFLKSIGKLNKTISSSEELNLASKAQRTIEDSAEELSALQMQLKTAQQNNDYSEIDVEAITQRILELQDDIDNTITQTVVDKIDIQGLIRKLDNLQIDEVKADPEVVSQVKTLRKTLQDIVNDDAKEMLTEQYKEYAKQVSQLSGTVSKSDRTIFGNFMKELRHKNYQALAQFFSLNDIIRYMREAISVIKQYDTALIEMMKVSDETRESLERYQATLFDTADAIGSAALTLEKSTADWMRIGESLTEAAKSAQAAQILMNVSEFQSIDEATQALVSASQAYADLDKMDIVDKINKLGNEFPIATDQLATALQNSAAALTTQGNDLNEALALVVGGNVITQDALKTGTGIRTIALRIAGTKEAKDELAELGEGVDDFVVRTESKTRQLIMDYTAVASNGFKGVDIYDANGNLRSTYQILQDIADIYKEIQLEDRQAGTNRANALVELLAGKNRSNIAASILTNPDTIREAYEAAQNAEGSAMKENEKYLTSVEAHITKFKNAVDELINDLIDSGFVNQIIDLGTKAVSAIDKLVKHIGGLGSTLLAIGLIVGGKKGFFSSFISNMPVLIEGFKQFSSSGLKLNEVMQLLGITFKSTKGEAVAFSTALSTTGVGLLIAGISLAITYLVKVVDNIKKAQQAVRDYAKETKDTNASLDEYAKRIGEARDVLSNEYSTTEEIINAKNELNEIQNELNETYGNYNDILKDTNATIEQQNALLIQNALNKNKEVVNQAKENNGNIWSIGGIITAAAGSEYDNALDFLNKDIRFKGDDWTDTSDIVEYARLRDNLIGDIFTRDGIGRLYLNNDLDRRDVLQRIQEAERSLSDMDSVVSQELLEDLKEFEDSLSDGIEDYSDIMDAIGQDMASTEYADDYNNAMEKYFEYLEKGTDESRQELVYAVEQLWKDAAEENNNASKYWIKSFFGEFTDAVDNEAFNTSWKELNRGTTYALGRDRNSMSVLSIYSDWLTKQGVASDEILRYLQGSGNVSLSDEQKEYIDAIRGILNQFNIGYKEGIAKLVSDGLLYDTNTMDFNKQLEAERQEAIESGVMTGEEFDALGINDIKELDTYILKVKNAATNATEAMEMFTMATSGLAAATGASDVLKDMESHYRPVFNAMAEAYQAIWTTEGYDITKVTSAQLEGIRSQFESINSSLKEVGVEGIDDSDIDEFILKMVDVETTEEEAQEAFNKLATTLIDSLNPAIAQASGATAELMQKTLTEMGVVNAEKVVMSRLGFTAEQYAKAKEEAANNDLDIDQEIGKLTDEQLLLIANNEALLEYYSNRILANSLNIETAEDIEGLLKLCKTLKIATIGTYSLIDAEKKFNEIQNLKKIADTAGSNSVRESYLQKYNDAIAEFKAQAEVDWNPDINVNFNPNETSSTSSGSTPSPQDFDWIERAIKKIQRAVTNFGKIADATYKVWGTRIDGITNKYGKLQDEIILQQQAAQAYMQEANAVGLNEEYASKVRDGLMDIETITDETLKDQISKYQEYYDKATDAADAVEDLRGEIAQLAQAKFDNITKQFEEMALAIDHAATRIGHIQSKMSSEGYFESSTLIEQLLFGDKEKLSQLEDEARQLAASIDKAVANGDIEYGSEQWWGMYDSLQNVNDQIVEMKSNMADLNDQLRQMDWDRFDYIQDSIERLRTENDFLIETLETENQLFEKVQLMNTDIMVSNGNWTETATAIQGLRVNSLEILKQQNEEVAEEIKKVNADLANDPNNKKLLERRNALIDQQQDIIKGITQEKQSIKSLIQEGYETFLNYLQKSIDKRKEALRAEKSLYDYQRTISDQTKTIADYRKQLAALSGGTDSEENRVRLQQLKDDLTKAEKDLQDTEYERWLTDQEEMMDSMYESFENLINEKLDDLEGLIERAIQQTKDNSDSIAKTIGDQADEFIYDLDNASFGVNFDARISDAVTAVNAVENAINTMINAANVNAQNELAQLQALAQTIVTQAQVQAQQAVQVNVNLSNNGEVSNNSTSVNTSNSTNKGKANKSGVKVDKGVNTYQQNSAKISELEKKIEMYYAAYDNAMNEYNKLTPNSYNYADRMSALQTAGYYQQLIDQAQDELRELNKSKFAQGGTIGKAVKSTGEDGIILARTGEEVLSLERIKQMQGIFKMMQPLAALGTNKTISNIGGTTTVNGMNVSFELPNVTSYEDFVRQAKSDPTFEKLVQNITIGTALGKSKLSKYSL